MKVIVFLGPPGSGKGTQAQILSEKYGFKHIATGDIFRWHMEHNTELGKKIGQYLERGELVPDEITVRVVEDAILREKNPIGFIFDGFPRTLEQARRLDELLEKIGLRVDIVIYLKVSKDEAIRRLLARGRHDDRPDTIARRFDEYKSKTEPIKKYYEERGLLVEINGEQTIEQVHESIVNTLKSWEII